MDTIPSFSLAGKVAVVIGGTGELCGAISEAFAGHGARVALVGRNAEKGAARVSRIAAANGTAWFEDCDASDKGALENLLGRVIAREGRVDILVNGAGVNSATPFFDISDEEFDRIFRVNLKGVFFACQVFGRYFVDNKVVASIINIGSESGIIPLSRVFTYSATKAAVHNLSKNLAREWAPFGIRVNTLVPGFFPAEQNRKILQPERIAKILAHTPAGRFGAAPELGGAAVLLAGDASGFITGAEIVVDGGFNAMAL
ncbi:MAG: SDR family oxidoreductase [Puniceicoccales bacterium]|jgi:NAD(P)-dependent dehydrogenase (short-subunit alcohol dehydrogenase family)|nr:SDR family oxidoreductase [Puniceicoccales bacterium]